MSNPSEKKVANQVDDVLQGYLDQLLVTAISSARLVHDGSHPQDSKQDTLAGTAERAASAHIAAEVQPAAINIRRMPVRDVAEPTVLPSTVSLPVVTIADEEVVSARKASDQADCKISAPVDNATEEITLVSAEMPQIESEQVRSLNWRSSQGVECLIFKVAGLKLAIPLSVLGGVHNASDKITPLFGQAKWSLGVWQSDDQKLTIVDSASLMMPERNISLANDGFDYVIQLDRSPWALACQEICDTVTLVYDSIKWRGEQSKRPWLAGTVIAEMCALIDVPCLLDMLDGNSRP